MSARGALRVFLVEALVASTLSLMLLASLLVASLRAERRANLHAAERSARALAASARHLQASGGALASFVDPSGLSSTIDAAGNAVARARTPDGRIVDVLLAPTRLEGTP